jgi:hypothetical protein
MVIIYFHLRRKRMEVKYPTCTRVCHYDIQSDEDPCCGWMADRIIAFQDFDMEEFGKAMACIETQWFELWRKPTA